MITVYNAKNYAQQWLFEKAFTSLKNKNKLTEAEIAQGRFLSLDGYFAHMKDLIEINPNYVMLPTDEKPFEINANSRAITIPADFSKCAGVAGDDMCEIVTFTIDRYFDYVDLATTQICVQWVAANGKEGISHIALIDTETISGKIRFGWPLTGEIASKAGNVTFAVRFFTSDENDKFVYLFNTLTASIPIRQGLQIEDPEIEEENVVDLFSKFVKNSNNPSYPIPSPVFFGAPGLNLPQQEAIDSESNTLELKGQAIVEDNGHIMYQWYFLGTDKEDAEKISGETDKYLVKETYEIIEPKPEERVGSEQYFKEVTDEMGAKAYSLVTTKDLPDEDLYERFTTLTIKDSDDKDVTGKYWFGATNYIGVNNVDVDESGTPINAVNYTNESYSNKCIVPAPIKVEITKDLPDNIFIENGVATLSIEDNKDSGNPVRVYSWYRNEISGDSVIAEGNKISEADDKSYDAVVPGWYGVNVNSKLNRSEENKESNICRVINHANKPIVTKVSYKLEELDSWTELKAGDSINATLGDVFDLKVEASVRQDGQEDLPETLISDKITYTWFVGEPDKGFREINADDFGNTTIIPMGTKLGTNELKVRCTVDNEDNVSTPISYQYYCKIENELAGEVATLEYEDYPVIFVIH